VADTCYSSIQGLIMRGTRVDSCGAPITGGTDDVVVSEGFVSIGLSSVIEDGTEYRRKNANGRFAIDLRGPKQFSRYDLAFTFSGVNPALFELVSGNVRVVTDYAGDDVGFAVDRDVVSDGFALEVWTAVPASPDAECVVGEEGSGLYVYWLLPWVHNGVLGDHGIEDDAVDFVINAETKHGNQWGRGPYLVVPINVGGDAGILDSPGVLTSEPYFQRITSIAPPEPVCGYAA